MQRDRDYVLGTHDDEIDHLGLQQLRRAVLHRRARQSLEPWFLDGFLVGAAGFFGSLIVYS